MRILQVASHQNITRGGAVQMVRLARALRGMGERVDLVFNGSGELSDGLAALVEEGFHVRLFPMDRTTPPALLDFRSFVIRGGYRVVHVHRDPALKFAFLALLGTNVPLVAQRGTTYRPKGITGFVLRSPGVARVVAVAHAVHRSLYQSNVPPQKVEVAYGSADPQEFSPAVPARDAREGFGILDTEVVVGTVAALVGKKGYPHLFKAAAMLSPLFSSLRLLCLGRGRPEKFKEWWQPVSKMVVFAGHRDDVASCMATMDMVVCASTKGEGLTGALREAMLMGKPVVSTAVSGNPEVVLHGHTGLLVPVGDARALSKAISILVESPKLRFSLGAKGRALALGLFSDESRARRVMEIYRGVAGN